MQSKDQGKKMVGLLKNFKGLKQKVAAVEQEMAQMVSNGAVGSKAAAEMEKLSVRKALLVDKLGKLEMNLKSTGAETVQLTAMNEIERGAVRTLRAEERKVNGDVLKQAKGKDKTPETASKKEAQKKSPAAEMINPDNIVANSRLTGAAKVRAMEEALLTEKLLSNPSELKKLMDQELVVLKDGGYHLTEKATKLIDDGHNVGKKLFDQDF